MILEEKYGSFDWSNEFPDLYMLLLYESGGDFDTYSKILGYDSPDDFDREFKEFNEKHKDEFKPRTDPEEELTAIQLIETSYGKLEIEYDNEVKQVDLKIKELSKFLKNVRTLSMHQGDFYSYRQTLASRRRSLRKAVAQMTKHITKEERKVLDSYKRGITQSQYVKDVSVLPKNDLERNLYMDDDLANIRLVQKLTAEHLEYISDGIDNLDKQILGLKYALELEQYRSSMG